MRNRYFLMRHGQSEANRQNLIISDPKIGCEQYGLTEEGRRQARESARKVTLPPETVIVSSDFLRARETAQIAREVYRCPEIRMHQGLRERYFGRLEGTSCDRYHEVWEKDSHDPDHTPFAAESPRHLVSRLKRTVEQLEEEFNNNTVLLVSHGDPLRFLQLFTNQRALTEHMELLHFGPAEIRELVDLKPARGYRVRGS